MSIDVVNETEADIDIASIGQQARFVLDRLRIHAGAELSVVFVDTATMTDLHVRWMDEPGPTDVLSFPMDELTPPRDDEEPPEGLLGDVVICPEVADRQAAAAASALEDRGYQVSTAHDPDERTTVVEATAVARR